MTRLAVAVTALALLAACSTPTPHAAPPTASDVASSDTAPTHLTYPAIDVDTDVEPTGLNPDGTIHVPDLDQAAEVDYLNWGPNVRAGRPLVFVSHVNGRTPDGRAVPGGFFQLAKAHRGDTITVAAESGAEARYRVTSVDTIPKAEFPTSIYNPRAAPTLILITCGGQLVDHNYVSNVIVTATAA
jgi:hypothetical protein